MREVSFENFRCFRERQTARLAPLTLLVGENSTGKTSLLALISALSNLAYFRYVPTHKTSVFTEDPYDLGSFDEIAHHRGAGGGHAKTFQVGFAANSKRSRRGDLIHYDFTFCRKKTGPALTNVRVSFSDTFVELNTDKEQQWVLDIGTKNGIWRWTHSNTSIRFGYGVPDQRLLQYLYPYVANFVNPETYSLGSGNFTPVDDSPFLTKEHRKRLKPISVNVAPMQGVDTVATAPVRSKPRRTYDPLPPEWDPEGAYIPMYLANLSFSNQPEWEELRAALERFGQTSGLFDEISVRHFGKKDSEPFQVQVRKFGAKLKGPKRNLIDMGYGISQVLPVITELLKNVYPSNRVPTASTFLLQQPEVHLHPSAQAALGSLFCQLVRLNRQLVVETHSDHLIDRVRMDVRDNRFGMSPDDVSILYFDRSELDVGIHSLRLDQYGNVCDAPDNYRRFFMEETRRSLGL